MNPKLRSILVAIGILTIAILAIVLIPRGLSLYYQSRGGQHIDYVLRSVEGIEELVCEQLPEDNLAAIDDVNIGVEDLKRAVRLNSNNSQAHYYLGKAYCLFGWDEEAIGSFMSYTELRPENPLGHLTLALANYKYCDGKSGEMCQDQDVKDRVKKELELSGIDGSSFLQEGFEAFNDREFERSIFWFSLSEISESRPGSTEYFPWMVSEYLLGKPIDDWDQITRYAIDDLTMIEAESMYWITPRQLTGKQVGEIPSSDPNAGVLWTNGTAVALIEIPKAGEYELKLRVLDSPPSPIIFQVEIDFNKIVEFSFTGGDSTWRDVVVRTTLNEGSHVIGVSFLNDEIVGELDRNLLFDWIQISGSHN